MSDIYLPEAKTENARQVVKRLEAFNAAMASDSYEAVLRLCFKYVDVE